MRCITQRDVTRPGSVVSGGDCGQRGWLFVCTKRELENSWYLARFSTADGIPRQDAFASLESDCSDLRVLDRDKIAALFTLSSLCELGPGSPDGTHIETAQASVRASG